MNERGHLGAPQPVVSPQRPSAAVVERRIDRYPKSAEDWRVFAALPAADRCAVYLRSIRVMLVFFVVLTVLGIIAGVVFGFEGFPAFHQSGAPTPNSLFGQ